MEMVINRIRKSKRTDEDFLVHCFREAGIQTDHVLPQETQYMKPQGSWQEPHQLAQLLILLSKYQIETFLEIGTFFGVTTSLITSFLSRYKLKKAISIDIFSRDIPDVEKVKKILPIDFQLKTSQDFKDQHFDLCFIDGDHNYQGVKTDFENVGQFSTFCAFHDIINHQVPGVIQFWNEIKKQYPYHEFTHADTFGIGLLEVQTPTKIKPIKFI